MNTTGRNSAGKRALVTGASGFIGTYLCRRLLENGYTVRALEMDEKVKSSLEKQGMQVLLGDITKPETLKGICDGIDIVFHLAAHLGPWGRRSLFYGSIYDGTANLLNEAAHKVSRFVYFSSICAAGAGGVRRHLTGHREDDPEARTGASYYCDAKFDAEKLVYRFHNEGKFAATIVRPANVFGPRSVWIVNTINVLRNSRNFPVVDEGRYHASLVYVENLVDGVMLAATKDIAKGRAYHFRDDYDVTWKRYFSDIGALSGESPRFVSAPFGVAWAAGFLNDMFVRPFGVKINTCRHSVGLTGRANDVDTERAKAELGWKTRVPYTKAMEEVGAWISETYGVMNSASMGAMKALSFSFSVPQFIALKALGGLSKKSYYRGPLRTIRPVEMPVPALPSRDWVRIKTVMAGMCGSNMHAIFLEDSPTWSPFVSGPAVMGHEIVGRVAELGANVKQVKPGDMVVVCPTLTCEARGIRPACRSCREGLGSCENTAEGNLPPGLAVDTCKGTVGGFAEFTVAHRSQVFRVPDGMSPESAVMIEPLAIALQTIISSTPAGRDHVLVIGGGVIGNLVIQSIRAMGIRCTVTLAASSRQAEELAKAAGADHVVPFGKIKAHAVEQTGAREYKPALGDTLLMGGYDRIYDCLGTSVSMNASLRCVRTGGTISVVGISGSLALDPAPIYLKIPVIRGALYYGAAVWKGKKTHVFQIAIDLARAGKVRLDHLVTHKFPMDRYVEMIEVNRHKGRHNAVKTVMTFD